VEPGLARDGTQKVDHGARKNAQLLKSGLHHVEYVSSIRMQLIADYHTREHAPHSIVKESIASGKTEPFDIHVNEGGESD